MIEGEARRWSTRVPDAEQIVVAARRQQAVVAVRQAAHLLRVFRQSLCNVLCRSSVMCMNLSLKIHDFYCDKMKTILYGVWFTNESREPDASVLSCHANTETRPCARCTRASLFHEISNATQNFVFSFCYLVTAQRSHSLQRREVPQLNVGLCRASGQHVAVRCESQRRDRRILTAHFE
jgi:hypothetical protein